MKKFQFTLARTRAYKNQLLNWEKDALAHCKQRERELEEQLRLLCAALSAKQTELARRQRAGMSAGELGVYRLFQENGAHRMEDLKQELDEASSASERQLQRVLTAMQEVSSMDKLEERQREEYDLLTAQESEKELSELLSTRVVRERAAQLEA